jgi:AcrR family transcriptional regulator
MSPSGDRRRPPSPAAAARAATGLRERKKLRTRETIQREAMRLFAEQGYDATTIEQIAAAAEVSPSTFFNYFPTKEDVVLSDDYDPVFAAAFLQRPVDEPLGVAFRRTLTETLAGLLERDHDVVLTRTRLVLDVPSLRARVWEDMERSQALIRALIAERYGRDPDDFDLRVTAGALFGAFYEAGREWARHGGRDDLLELFDRALDVVEAGVHLDDVHPSSAAQEAAGEEGEAPGGDGPSG